MKCTTIKSAIGNVIVCGRNRVLRCRCGNASAFLCDWRIDDENTCSALLCSGCATSPAPDKHLCVEHTELWAKHPGNPANTPKLDE